MRQAYISEINVTQQFRVAYHEIMLPQPSDYGFYRTIGSFNSFFHGKKKYNHNKADGLLYHATDMISIQATRDVFKINIEIIKHTSLSEFFNHIGWDHKVKKYNGKSVRCS